MESLLRFVIGGIVVSLFAVIGCLFRPRSFAGLFAAAPTIALATLGLAFYYEGTESVATAARSMVMGAVALCVYSAVAAYLLLKRDLSSLPAAMASLVAWFGVSFGLGALLLKAGAP